MARSVWLRESRDGAERRLSRRHLVSATVDALDAHGLAELTMRGVAGRLGVTVGALYWYVAGRDELLELALDAVLAEVAVRPPAEPDDRGWRDELGSRARRQRAVLLAHPWAVELVGRLPNIGPNAVASAEVVLDAATRAGFSTPAHVLATLHDHVVGAVAGQLAWRRMVGEWVGEGAPGDSPSEHLARAAERFPNLATAVGIGERRAAVGDVVSDVDSECDARFSFALDCLLDGLGSHLRDRPEPGGGPRRDGPRGTEGLSRGAGG